jgi:hypothetical protein
VKDRQLAPAEGCDHASAWRYEIESSILLHLNVDLHAKGPPIACLLLWRPADPTEIALIGQLPILIRLEIVQGHAAGT